MPMVIGAVVALIAVYTSSPQSSFESMQLLNIEPLFVELPLDHDWSRLAKSFSLLTLDPVPGSLGMEDLGRWWRCLLR